MDLKPPSASSRSDFSSVWCQIHTKILKSASLSPLDQSLSYLFTSQAPGTRAWKVEGSPICSCPAAVKPLPLHYPADYILGHLNYQEHQIKIASARPLTMSPNSHRL